MSRKIQTGLDNTHAAKVNSGARMVMNKTNVPTIKNAARLFIQQIVSGNTHCALTTGFLKDGVQLVAPLIK